ncbi:hypothetical protein [Kordiimonas pumila]|uniref:Integrase n=1 Tax=Kordiimonas pumila TaxID=2161677 RepID=A0ABV7D3C0_9PROT|nr:hypothetical protein [Kordiimonas pumila]
MRFNVRKNKPVQHKSPIEFLPLEEAELIIKKTKIPAATKEMLVALLRRIG